MDALPKRATRCPEHNVIPVRVGTAEDILHFDKYLRSNWKADEWGVLTGPVFFNSPEDQLQLWGEQLGKHCEVIVGDVKVTNR